MTTRLDVLFVIPVNVTDFAGAVPDAIEPPAKARFMAAYLMRRNCGVDLIDANLTNDSPEVMAEKVKVANPYLVVVPVYGFNPSASTQTMVPASQLAEAIKGAWPDAKIVVTGTHPAAVPETTLCTEPDVDFVCGGEGPITVHELLQALKGGTGIERVRSLWYWQDGGVVHNSPAPPIDLNQEPVSGEAWRLMNPRNYRAHHWHAFYGNDRSPYANPYAREGCPFHCSFCNIQAPYREGESHLRELGSLKVGVNDFRSLRPELFLEEITYLVEEFGVKLIKIPDEMFGLGPYPSRLAELIRDRFGDSLNIWCYFRVDTCRPKELELLRSAGFRWLALGIEAANSKVRSGQDKRFSDERIYEVVGRLNAAGIEGALNYIFGLPEDTEESMEETLKLACELNGTYGNFYCTQALPGSELYRQALANGYPLPQRKGGPGWISHAQYSFASEPYYEGDVLTPAQILAFRDWAHVVYYTRDEYISKLKGRPELGDIALRNISDWMNHIRSLKRALFGGRAFWELPEEERVKLVPASARQIDTAD